MSLFEYLKSNRTKLIQTCFCFLSFLCLGGCCTLLGSSLLDLSIWLNAPFKKVSGLVPSRSIGYIIGGVLSGFVDRLAGPNMVLCTSTFTAGALIGMATWFKQFSVIYACLLLSGISQGVYDIYSNTYIFGIWGDKSTNYIQILHGCFGLGSLLTPLIIKPFLLPLSQNQTNSTQSDDTLRGDYTSYDVTIQYPFVVVGIFLIFASGGFLVFHFKKRSSGEDKQAVDGNKLQADYPAWKIFVALIVVGLIAHTTFAVEVLVASLAPSFVVLSDLKMSKQDGANIVTMFWCFYTFYRILFIAATNYVKEHYLMYFNYALVIVAIILMCPNAAYNQLIAWISLGVLALGFSPTFSAAFGLLPRYINVSNKYASFIFFIGSLGEAIHPWIVTRFMEAVPVFLIYYIAAVSFVQITLCFLLPYICEAMFKKSSKLPFDRAASIRLSKR